MLGNSTNLKRNVAVEDNKKETHLTLIQKLNSSKPDDIKSKAQASYNDTHSKTQAVSAPVKKPDAPVVDEEGKQTKTTNAKKQNAAAVIKTDQGNHKESAKKSSASIAVEKGKKTKVPDDKNQNTVTTNKSNQPVKSSLSPEKKPKLQSKSNVLSFATLAVKVYKKISQGTNQNQKKAKSEEIKTAPKDSIIDVAPHADDDTFIPEINEVQTKAVWCCCGSATASIIAAVLDIIIAIIVLNVMCNVWNNVLSKINEEYKKNKSYTHSKYTEFYINIAAMCFLAFICICLATLNLIVASCPNAMILRVTAICNCVCKWLCLVVFPVILTLCAYVSLSNEHQNNFSAVMQDVNTLPILFVDGILITFGYLFSCMAELQFEDAEYMQTKFEEENPNEN